MMPSLQGATVQRKRTWLSFACYLANGPHAHMAKTQTFNCCTDSGFKIHLIHPAQ